MFEYGLKGVSRLRVAAQTVVTIEWCEERTSATLVAPEVLIRQIGIVWPPSAIRLF